MARASAATHRLDEANLRAVFSRDGFTPQEIDAIVSKGKLKADEVFNKSIVIKSLDNRDPDTNSAVHLNPSEFAKLWPFLMLRGDRRDLKPLMIRSLQITVAEGWEMAIPFARWAQFLPSSITEDTEIRSLVPAMVAREPHVVGQILEKLLSAMHFAPGDFTEAITENAFNPLAVVTLIDPKHLPAHFLEATISHWFVPGTIWADLPDPKHAVRIVLHTDAVCGGCGWMAQTHHETLSVETKEHFGRTVLIRLHGQIIGAVKGVRDSSFLALRNVGAGPGTPNFLWAGGVYQPDSGLVARVKRALETNPHFPVIDVQELTLKPIDFLTDDQAERETILDYQTSIQERFTKSAR